MLKGLSKRSGRRAADVYEAHCPSRKVLDHVTSRWGSLALVVLLEDTHRFSELRRKIGGVSDKMLAQSLRALEGDGLLLRTVYPTVPPSVAYSLTPLGREVATCVHALTEWVERNLPTISEIQKKRERRPATR